MDSMERKALIVLICGSLALTISFGIRSAFGLFLPPVSAEMGWSVAYLSFVIALQNLIWGAAQPVAGAIADSRGARFVAIWGAVIYVGGLLLMAWGGNELLFGLGGGVLIGFALAALGFPVILGAVGRAAPDNRRSLYTGIATAGGSFGQFLFAPIGQELLSAIGWVDSLLALAAICMLIAALALGVRSGSPAANPVNAPAEPELSLREALGEAMRHRGFLLLTAGFFVCGFQVAFIGVHLPTFAALCGLPVSVGATGIALIGLFNIIGSIGAGYLGGRMRPKFPLSLIYFGRAVAILPMVLLPVTEVSLLIFSAVMGLLWLSTVPLTNGVIAQIFGPRHLGMLFGIVFFGHQLGSFAGVWIAGYAYDAFNSYDLVWWISIALGVAAGIVHLPIRDERVRLRPQPA